MPPCSPLVVQNTPPGFPDNLPLNQSDPVQSKNYFNWALTFPNHVGVPKAIASAMSAVFPYLL